MQRGIREEVETFGRCCMSAENGVKEIILGRGGFLKSKIIPWKFRVEMISNEVIDYIHILPLFFKDISCSIRIVHDRCQHLSARIGSPMVILKMFLQSIQPVVRFPTPVLRAM